MTCLLDTHCFLWAIRDAPQLSPRAKQIIRDGRNDMLLSVASIWEIILKAQVGRLHFPQPAADFLKIQIVANRIRILSIELRDVLRLEALPLHHRDPFDRILVAQSLEAGVPILSADSALRAYGAEIIW